MKEIWKDIPNYEGYYQASTLGRIKSIKFGYNRILKTSIAGGYFKLGLWENGVRKTFSVHRLIGLTFILNSENKLEINHKNRIKKDNKVGNLEWATRKENNIHARKNNVEGYRTYLKCIKCNLIFPLTKFYFFYVKNRKVYQSKCKKCDDIEKNK